MRTTFLKLVTAIGLVSASAVPALACGGGGLFSAASCSPCGGQAYVSPCAQGYGQSYGYGQGYGQGYGYGVPAYQQLPTPSAQYYYANQGPTFSGPGNFAPYPTYQETAVSGYQQGGEGYGYGSRYSYAEPEYRAPMVYSYRPQPRPSYRYGYSMRPRVHYGYTSYRSHAPRYGYRHRHFAVPRMTYAPRYAAPSHGYRHNYQRPLRRLY